MKNDNYKISLKKDRSIISILGEICWGFKINEFEKKIGVEKAVVEDLLERLLRKEKAGAIEVYLNNSEIEIIKKALSEVEKEIEEWEFHTRIGTTLEEVKKIDLFNSKNNSSKPQAETPVSANHLNENIDMTQLLTVFDELMPATDEEQGIYWFRTKRSDGLIITFAFSTYEKYADIIIHNTSKIDIASVSLENCSNIKVLDEKRKCLEVLHNNGKGRCFLSLLESPILEYKDQDTNSTNSR